MAVNFAAFLASVEAKVAAAATTADGLKLAQELAPDFAQLAIELKQDFSETASKVYADVEAGAVSAEQHAMLATKAITAKLFMDATNIFSRVAPPAA